MKGQTLIEALLALSVITIIISAISVTTVIALNNADFGKNQALATQYAQEGAEVLRNIRNSDYPTFATYEGNYCLAKGANSASSLVKSHNCIPNFDSFIRSISIEQFPPGCGVSDTAKVTVTVAWKDGKCANGYYCHSSKLISCLSTINPVQSP